MQSQAQQTFTLKEKLTAYAQLMRMDKPIGTYLVMWPALWALWIAAEGVPDLKLLFIFVAGAFLTRSAGCAINDFADRKVDGHVKRTQHRPIPSGRVSPKEAVLLFSGFMLLAFVLVLFTNWQTILLSFGAVALTAVYPFMKRYTHLPQVVLGAAFAWAVPMAFSAVTGTVPWYAWLIYGATVLWTVAYDTLYAMVDRDDDLKIGVKSTAILFGDADKLIVSILKILTLALLIGLGLHLQLSIWYYLGLAGAAVLFIRQQYMVRNRERDLCFSAFLNNHYVGLLVFTGILAHYLSA
ncbi:4-hydroxybenzoate octaprenyltransferase [Pontibacterium sp.]|uniref:4-hydroxybenzoate octaprenyltransferase n=1 Tax=Pontibacterium sp. TaxID=2036026 RepID=UPI0035112BE0